MKIIHGFIDNIRLIQSHILGLIIVDIFIIFLPLFNDGFNLPKLSVLTFGSGILLLLELVHFFFSKRKYYIDKFDILLLFFLCFNFISYSFSASKSVSFWGFYPFEGLNFFYIPDFIATAWIFRRISVKEKQSVLQYIFYGIAFVSTFVLYEYIQSTMAFHDLQYRPGGLEGHPVSQAGIIGIGLLLAFFIKIDYISPAKKNIIKILVISLELIDLYILRSATAWFCLGIAASAGIYIGFFKTYKKNRLKTTVILIIAFLLFILGTSYLVRQKQFSIYRRMLEIKGVVKILKGEYFSSIVNIKNWAIGHGQNMSAFYYPKYKLLPSQNDKEWNILLTNFHNHFFEIFFTTGILPLLTWLIFMIVAFQISLKKKKGTYGTILVFLFVWQQLYLLQPSLHVLSWLFLFYNIAVTKSIEVPKSRSLRLLVALFILSYVYFSYSQMYTIIKAEIAFNSYDPKKAISLTSYNEYYIKSEMNKSLTLMTFCETRKSPQFPECNYLNILKNLDNSIAYGKIITQLNPLNPENCASYGDIMFKKYLFSGSSKIYLRQNALVYGKKAMDLDPTNPEYSDNVGLVYFDAQDYHNAEYYWLRSFHLKPDNNPTLSHLKDLYARTGDNKKSQYFETLLHAN